MISKREGNFRWIALQRTPLVVWTPKEHPLAERGTFPLEAFSTETYIEIERREETDHSLFLKKKGIHPHISHETYDFNAAYAMVAAGLGVSLVNGLETERWMEDIAVLPLEPAEWVEIGIALPQKERMSPAAKRFADLAVGRLQAGERKDREKTHESSIF